MYDFYDCIPPFITFSTRIFTPVGIIYTSSASTTSTFLHLWRAKKFNTTISINTLLINLDVIKSLEVINNNGMIVNQ